MKGKVVSAYLSIAGFLQLVILAISGGLVSEISKTSPNGILVASLTVVVFGSACIVVGIYLTIFYKTSKRK
jgi:hypothetical protein